MSADKINTRLVVTIPGHNPNDADLKAAGEKLKKLLTPQFMTSIKASGKKAEVMPHKVDEETQAVI